MLGPAYQRERIVLALTRAQLPETIQRIILHHHDRAVKLAEQKGFDHARDLVLNRACAGAVGGGK